jgi:phosphomannomutase
MQVKDVFMNLQNGNDVRGAAIATEKEARTLTGSIAEFIAAGFISFLAERTGKAVTDLRIGVGHDSRLTGEAISQATEKGLGEASVYDCGLASTPAMFQSTVLPGSSFDGAIMITASHLPFNRNGMKFFTKDGGLEHDEMTDVLTRAAALAEKYGKEDPEDIVSAELFPLQTGKRESFDMVDLYSEAMRAIIKEEVQSEDHEHPLKGLHIVLDAGNGAAGFFATDILEPLGADISGSVFLEPDGTFPNHVPNPEDRKAMEAASAAVLRAKADLGVIFDCDGDRGAVVFGDGKPVNRNRLIGLLASIIAEHYPGSTIVTDSVTSDELTNFLEDSLGLKHLRFKRGYKNVINKGIELNAAGEECRLAIETSGHGAFKENYFSDDGAYIAVRVIAKLAVLRREGKKLESLIEKLEDPAESIEVRYQIAGEDFAAYGGLVLEEFRAWAVEQPLFHVVEPNYEGVRIAFDDEEVKGWLLIRKSLHDPVLPMNIESKEAGGTDVILERINDFFARYKRLSV